MKSRAHVFISGIVQGVFFRANTKQKALELGLTGWVRNLRDGRVEAVFEGERTVINQMLDWCRIGPPYAKVYKVDVHWGEYTGEFTYFEVRY
jgi:acylphosphatase